MSAQSLYRVIASFLFVAGVAVGARAQQSQPKQEGQPQQNFVGRVNAPADAGVARAVLNQPPQRGEEVVTLRYFKFKKGSYDEVSKLSREGVWPYFEKIGARSIGMWRVITPEGLQGAQGANPEYDEVYMMTRYASLDHWKATRDAATLGGNGPDWIKCQEALEARAKLTLGTSVWFLKGGLATGGPYFMPPVAETQEKK